MSLELSSCCMVWLIIHLGGMYVQSFSASWKKKLTGQFFNHGELGGVMSSHTKALVYYILL